MNDCALTQEMISRVLDDDLSADERAALAKHLESCESCRTLYEAFAAVSASLGEIQRLSASITITTGYIITISALSIAVVKPIRLFQCVVPSVLGMISANMRIRIVVIAEMRPNHSDPNTIVA